MVSWGFFFNKLLIGKIVLDILDTHVSYILLSIFLEFVPLKFLFFQSLFSILYSNLLDEEALLTCAKYILLILRKIKHLFL